jgi:O-antigen ligase
VNSDHGTNGENHLPITKIILLTGLGCLLGVGVFLLLDKEIRWFLAPALALASAIFILVVPQKKSVLTVIFILSFQVDIYLRFLYGRSGANDGLALPFVVATGIVLSGWYYFAGQMRGFTWGGSMRRPIMAFLIIVAVSAIASRERFVGLCTFVYVIEYYFLYWMAFNIVRSEADFRRVVHLILGILAIQAIVYFAQSAMGITFDFLGNTIEKGEVARPGGTVSSNPAGFVSFIVPALMMASAVALSKYRVILGLYSIPLMILGIAAVGLSYTRAAWIGLVFGFFSIGLIGARRHWLNFKMIVGVLVLATIGLSALLPTMLERVSSDYGHSGASTTTETYNERMGLNMIALNVIAHHPLLGVGPGAYPYEFRQFIPAGMNQWVFTVHNVYLLWAAETGVLGGIVFIALLVTGFRVAIRLSRGPTSFISICATGWFGAMVILSWMMFWVPWIGFSYNAMFWFMLGLMDGAQRLVRHSAGRHPTNAYI